MDIAKGTLKKRDKSKPIKLVNILKKVALGLATIFITTAMAGAVACATSVNNAKNLIVPDAHSYDDIETAVEELEAEDRYIHLGSQVEDNLNLKIFNTIYRYNLKGNQPIELVYNSSFSEDFVEKLNQQAQHLNYIFSHINTNFKFKVVSEQESASPNKIMFTEKLPLIFKFLTNRHTVGMAIGQLSIKDESFIWIKDNIETDSPEIMSELILHEVMHILGFGDDYYNKATIMRSSVGGKGVFAKLMPNDLKILYCLYGDINDAQRTNDFKEFINWYTDEYNKEVIKAYFEQDNHIGITETQLPPPIMNKTTFMNLKNKTSPTVIEIKKFNQDNTVDFIWKFDDGTTKSFSQTYQIIDGAIFYERPDMFGNGKCYYILLQTENGFAEYQVGRYYPRKCETVDDFEIESNLTILN